MKAILTLWLVVLVHERDDLLIELGCMKADVISHARFA
jgi:hypothetical protein